MRRLFKIFVYFIIILLYIICNSNDWIFVSNFYLIIFTFRIFFNVLEVLFLKIYM